MATAIGELDVKISADIASLQKDVAKMRKSMNRFKKSTDQAKSRLASFEKGVKTLGAAAGSILALGKAWDLAFEAAKFQQSEQAFANLASSHGANAQMIVENLKIMSGQTLSTAQVMESAGTAMLLGIPADKLGSMMEIARAASRVTGDTVQKSFQDIAKGMGRQSKLILDNLGIIVSVEKANQAYARTLNKSVSQLTDAEKKQAFFNATMKAGRDIVERVNVQSLTAAEAMQKFKARMADLGIIVGKALISVTAFGNALLSAIQVGVNATVLGLTELIAKFVELGRFIPGLKDRTEDLAKSIRGWNDHNKLAVRLGKENVKQSIEVGTAIWKQSEATQGIVRRTEDLVQAEDNLIKKQAQIEKKIGDIITKTFELTASKQDLIMIEATEFEAMGATANQIDRLIEARQKQFDMEEKLKAQKELETLETKRPGADIVTPQTELQQVIELNDQKLVAMQDFHAQRIELMRKAGSDEADILTALAEKDIALEEQKRNNRIRTTMSGLNTAEGFFRDLNAINDNGSKRLFKLQKAAGIAQALVGTYAGAASALKDVPYPFNIAAAASVVVAGLSRVRQIQATNIGGGAGGGGGGISGGTVTPTSTTFGTPAIPNQTQAQTQNIEIVINSPLSDQNWQKIIQDEVVPQLQEAQQLNVSVLQETT